MEKHAAHYNLTAIKEIVASTGAAAFTRLALREIDAMGLTFAEAHGVVLDLQRACCTKA